jgi:ABC-2 type transport system ATP-binding protein
MTTSVDVAALSKRFGSIQAVSEISFRVESGTVLGFLGPNGAGKSTTMKMITGFLAPDSGRVTVNGIALDQDPVAVKRSMGYLPEGAPLYADMTPRALLRFIGEVRGLRGDGGRRRLDEVVARVNLGSVLDQPIETLSKGFKRRVGLAQAILHDPSVLILDEPTDGLDPNQKHEVRRLIREMAQQKVIILSTHILEEVEAVCGRAMVIADGRVVADGTPLQLESRSKRHNVVVLELYEPEAEIERELGGLSGVAEVRCLESEGRKIFEITPSAGQDLTPDISILAVSKRWKVARLYLERGRLDDVFRDITLGPEKALSNG